VEEEEEEEGHDDEDEDLRYSIINYASPRGTAALP
jgi:hypothetical protein